MFPFLFCLPLSYMMETRATKTEWELVISWAQVQLPVLTIILSHVKAEEYSATAWHPVCAEGVEGPRALDCSLEGCGAGWPPGATFSLLQVSYDSVSHPVHYSFNLFLF